MNVYIGTSGFSYPAWRGSFYPDKLPEPKMLAFYAQKLRAVEINNTFYRMPNPELFTRWAGETPPEFRFAVKSPRRITHQNKLANSTEELARLATGVEALGDKLGPILFQLPPFMKKDVLRLDDFLAALPARLRPAMEFRHESWFADDVYACLRARRAALCLAESEDLATPPVATADWGYLRLRRQDYDQPALAAWAARVRAQTQTWSDTYVFFKHEDEGKGPALAATFGDLLR